MVNREILIPFSKLEVDHVFREFTLLRFDRGVFLFLTTKMK